MPAVGYATPQELDQAVGEIIAKINENLASPGFELSKDVLKRWNARMQVLIHFPDGPRYDIALYLVATSR